MKLKTIEKNGEKIAIIVLHGKNRSPNVLFWQQRVMVDYFGFVINYFECAFPHLSHGECMNAILKQSLDAPDAPDYYLFIDNDAIFLKKECLDFIYDMVKWKNGIWGCAWNSSHKIGPNGTNQHPYASQATICFSKEIYNKLGRPTCDWTERSDTSEEITYLTELKGYNLSLMYPSDSVTKTTDLSNGCKYGMGNIYGNNMFYHVSRQDLPESKDLFIEKCKQVLNGEFKNGQ